MSLFDRIFASYGAPAIGEYFADFAVATLHTVAGVAIPNLTAILSHEADDEDLDDGNRHKRRTISVKLRSCDGTRLPNPEVNSVVEVKDPKNGAVAKWAVVRTESWSETYVVLQCVRVERVERGVPGYRSAT